MSTLIAPPPDSDAQLVERSLVGDAGAFGGIVERYQGLICSLAYSACGNSHLSEDLAQETFIVAWRQLRDLREADKLKSWLCGIARNVIHNHLRKQRRTPTALAAELDESVPGPANSPSENAMNRQEEALVWRALEALPENYREPLVLFYRQQESIATVAAALDLSEDAVKQRLSRGRAMLAEQVGRLVKDSLRKSGPGRAFSLTVVAALPLLATSSCATTLGVTVAKGAATGKAASWAVFFSSVLSPLLGFLGAWFGYKIGIDSARTEEERRHVVRLYRLIVPFGTLAGILMLALIFSSQRLLHWWPAVFGAAVIAFIGAYAVCMICAIIWALRNGRKLHRQLVRDGAPEGAAPPGRWALPQYERRSNLRFLGLPLYHIRIGGHPGEQPGLVCAWFAAGDCAIGGLFAFGGIAIAPICFGGGAVGIISFGGVSLGALAAGGLAIGAWAVGGVAAGFQASGAIAAAWRAACGVIAVAHDFAVGERAALALHANDSAARALVQQSQFFQNVIACEKRVIWMNLLFLAPLALRLRRVRKAGPDRAETGTK